MKHQSCYNLPTANHVLSVRSGDVPDFLRKCMKDRALRELVCDLNDALLYGAKEERDAACKALSHLGFI